jgi:hypothetical protein
MNKKGSELMGPYHRSLYDDDAMNKKAGGDMALGGQPTAAEPKPLPVPADATTGTMDIMGEQVPTKKWRDDRGHAVHVGDVDFGDSHVDGVTGHSKQSPGAAEELVRRAVEHIVERMPFQHDDVDIATPTRVAPA